MPPDHGYQKAMHLLKDCYGNALKIATALMERVLKWPQVKSEDAQALSDFSLFFVSCRNALKDVDYMDELDNPANMRVIISKLPYKIKEKWRALAFEIQERTQMRVKFTDLVAFMDRQAKIVTDPLFGDLLSPATERKERKTSLMERKSKKEGIKRSSFATKIVKPREEHNKLKTDKALSSVAFTKPCLFCKQNHTLVECNDIAEKPHKVKLEFIRKAGLCFGCLGKGHISKDCKRKMTCQTCSERHPSLLHIPRKEVGSEPAHAECQEEVSAEKMIVSSALVSLDNERSTRDRSGDKCVLAVLPVWVKAKKCSKMVKTYAFVDPGSSATFCTGSLSR